MNIEALDACVRELRREMIEFTTELVGIASENPPGAAYADCVRAIESRLRALGMPCNILPYRSQNRVRDESGAAVVLSRVGTGARTLYSLVNTTSFPSSRLPREVVADRAPSLRNGS